MSDSTATVLYNKEDKVVAEFTVNTKVGKLVAEYKVNWVDRLLAECDGGATPTASAS